MTYPTNPADVWKTEVQDLQAASHLPALLACIAATTGPVLEIGVGFHSTPMLHSLLAVQNRRFVSLESDPYWLEVFSIYEAGLHELTVDNEVNLVEMTRYRWSVVFIDDSPGPPRHEHVRRFIDCADYVIVHDAQGAEITDPMKDLLSEIPHRFHKRFFPWTLVLSKKFGNQMASFLGA